MFPVKHVYNFCGSEPRTSFFWGLLDTVRFSSSPSTNYHSQASQVSCFIKPTALIEHSNTWQWRVTAWVIPIIVSDRMFVSHGNGCSTFLKRTGETSRGLTWAEGRRRSGKQCATCPYNPLIGRSQLPFAAPVSFLIFCSDASQTGGRTDRQTHIVAQTLN